MKVHCFYNCGATELTPSAMEAHYLKHHTKLRAYYGPEFTCDSCQKYWTSPLYSPARNSEELTTSPHYCLNCANRPTPTNLKPKNMKKKLTKKSKLTKLKPKRALKSKKTKSTALTLTKSPKRRGIKRRGSLTTKNTPAYYNCLLNQAKSGFKGKITKACQACKTNAPALNLAYKKEAQKLVGAYKQLGISLSKILSH